MHNFRDDNLLYSAADYERVEDLFSVQVRFLKFMGQIPLPLEKYLPPALRSVGWWAARLYSALIILSSLHLALLYVKTSFDVLATGELGAITDGLTMVIIYSFACYGTCYWLWRSQPLVAFMASIQRGYRHHSMLGLTFVSAQPAYSRARYITLCWLASCICGVSMWGLAPIIMRIRKLPLDCWYPFDPMVPGRYEIIYVMQLFGQICMGCTFGNGSALFVSLVLIMIGQFDVLFCSLKNMDFNARLLAGEDLKALGNIQRALPLGNDDELNQYLLTVEHKTDVQLLIRLRGEASSAHGEPLKSTLHRALVECVQLHRFVLESCATLEELFNPYCLVKSLQITLQLCLLVFVGVVGDRSLMRTINLIQYLALTSLELVMFTYCGELLRGHSQRCGEAFGRSEWWRNAHDIRNDVLIFLLNSRRVVKLTAGKFYLMDVERFRSVVTQAFSFFTLLQKLATKENK